MQYMWRFGYSMGVGVCRKEETQMRKVNPPQLGRAETTRMATMEIRDNLSFILSSRGVPSQRCADKCMQELSRVSIGGCSRILIIHFPTDRSTYDAIGQTDGR